MIAMLTTVLTLGSTRPLRQSRSGQSLDSFGQCPTGRSLAAPPARCCWRASRRSTASPPARRWPGPSCPLTTCAPPVGRDRRAEELQVSAQRAAGLPGPALALEAGTRYHLTTYGIWGFALASSPTVRSALDVGAPVRGPVVHLLLAGRRGGPPAAVDLPRRRGRARGRPRLRGRPRPRRVADDRRRAGPVRRTAGVVGGDAARPRRPEPWVRLFGRLPTFGAARNVAALDAGLPGPAPAAGRRAHRRGDRGPVPRPPGAPAGAHRDRRQGARRAAHRTVGHAVGGRGGHGACTCPAAPFAVC